MPPKRRTSDALRAVDGLVHAHIQRAPVDARVLANLALTMLTEYSGASSGALLLDQGHGLERAFALGPGLKTAAAGSTVPAPAPDLVREAVENQRLARRGPRLAAPILLGGAVRGLIYLEAEAAPFDADVADLAQAVASRIATLLHSAVLVEDAARREHNVLTLEAVGACLSAGRLTDDHLGRALDAALSSTASTGALLGLLGEDDVLDLHVKGSSLEALEASGRAIACELLAGRQPEPQPAERSRLLEPVYADFLPIESAGASRKPNGFLLVEREPPRPYSELDRTFFRALAHLLAGALARLAYFRKASEDALTGTGSRLALELAIVEALESAGRLATPLSIAIVDVDHFKAINDRHGHLVGDAILKDVASALRERLRARDFVARFGGDEFIVLLPETTTEDAARVAESLRELVAGRAHSEAELAVTLSIGVASFPEHAATPRDLVRRADEALYASKAAGRNRVSVAHG